METVWQPIDGGEDGRAFRPLEVAFTNKADADAVSKPLNYDEPASRAVYVLTSLQEYEAWKRDELRRKALAKLTAEERAALGL